MAEKRKKTYVFNKDWEEEFFFTSIRDKCVCLICGATVAISKRHNVERHYQTTHGSLNTNFPPKTALRAEKAREFKAALTKQQTFFTRPLKKAKKATEASFRATHYLIKNKKTFSDGEIVKGALMIIAETVFKDDKNGSDVISSLAEVQLGASTVTRRVSFLCPKTQLDKDLSTCRWFSIQCDESVDSSSTAQLMVFIRMVFDDFDKRTTGSGPLHCALQE